MSRPSPAPSARALATNSRSRSESVSARTIRAVPVHDTPPITTMRTGRLISTNAPMTRASGSAGTDSTTLMRPDSAVSVRPP